MSEHTRNRLNENQVAFLKAWINLEKDALIGKTLVEAAQAASKKLGFEVTNTNISTAYHQLGLKLHTAQKKKPAKIDVDKQLMKAQIKELQARVGQLETIISNALEGKGTISAKTQGNLFSSHGLHQ